jgi:hypothetical protein
MLGRHYYLIRSFCYCHSLADAGATGNVLQTLKWLAVNNTDAFSDTAGKFIESPLVIHPGNLKAL